MTIDLKAIRAVAESANKCGIGVNPATVIALLDRLEAAEAEVLEQARLLGIGGEKELVLMAKLEAAEKDAARYRWLKTGFRAMSLDMGGNHTWVQRSSSMLRGANVDEAIDAARKEQK